MRMCGTELCMQSGMRTGKLARTRSENTYAVKKCAQPRDARDGNGAPAPGAGRQCGNGIRGGNIWRCRLRAGMTELERDCAGVQKKGKGPSSVPLKGLRAMGGRY